MNIRGGFMGRMQQEEARFALSDLPRGSLPMLWRYVRPYRARLAVAAAAMLVASGASLAMPLLARFAVDECIVPGDFARLTWAALAYLGLTALFWPSSYLQGYLTGWVGQRVVHDLRRHLVGHVLRQALAFHQRERVGQVMSRVTNDTNAIAEFASTGLINLVSDLLTVAGIVAAMAILDWRLTLVTMLSVPVVVAGLGFIARRMRRAYTHVQEEMAAVNTGVEQGVAGMRVIQSLGRESFSIEQFESLSLRNMKANLRTAVLFAALFPVMTVSNMLSIALVIGYGGTLVAEGSMTLGVVLAFLSYITRFFGPLRELSLVSNAMQAAAASLARIQEYLQVRPDLAESAEPRRPEGQWQGHVSFRHVTFAYDGEPVLRDVDFAVAPGEKLAVAGPTGAGKSTLGLLLARLYDPGEGRIEIDGIDVREIDSRDLRSTVTVVPQDVYLFPGTVRDNIRYGDPQADDAAVERAARRVQAHDFIAGLPQGYDSPVGEGGDLLSGGQKQLVALARALLADSLILVLDETTAHVDALTEHALQAAMAEVAAHRTTLIIAHRFSTLSQAESVLVLEEGRVAGRGSHQELMGSCAAYRRLYESHRAGAGGRQQP